MFLSSFLSPESKRKNLTFFFSSVFCSDSGQSILSIFCFFTQILPSTTHAHVADDYA